jgi:putative aldouronate transport system permease protein
MMDNQNVIYSKPALKKNQSVIKTFTKNMYKSRLLYLMILPVLIYYFLFQYYPMYGAQIAFRDYLPTKGILGSPWVGFQYFNQFFHSIYLWRLIKNTIEINIYDILVGFSIPIILALMINEISSNIVKRSVQTIVYMPHFVSVVVVVGMLYVFLSPQTGMLNELIKSFGGKPIDFLGSAGWFQSLYVWSGVWQSAGWGSIIYIAALAGIDPALYESAMVDGASRWKRILHITIPCLLPTIIIMLILRMGSIFNVGFEKIMLMYSPETYSTADVISTYVYRHGIQMQEFSFATAVGLFNSLINFITLVVFNRLSRKYTSVSLW